ncbi:MAG: transglycosylase domain-containing protein [Lachnospiraceae bacterium]|nr:transglycosylase domain-containing protein [Lachnospiraceae bacterium]
MDYSKKGIRTKEREINAKGGKWFRKLILSCVELILIGILGIGICGVAAGIGVFHGILEDTPTIRVSDVVAPGQATIVYDKEGNEIDQYVSMNSNRIEVTIDQVPKHLGQAFVAIEDERYYQHNGIDMYGMVRAGYQFIKTKGKEKQGASTITQQLLKNTVFTSWTEEDGNMVKMVKRKVQEQYLALELTKNTNKDDVLLRYMNAINLGQNTLGVEAASLRYFGKSCSFLTLSECAVIASITQNPSAYNPLRHPDKNKQRREKCLNKMLDLGFITQDEYNVAMADTDAVYDRISLHDINSKASDTTSGSYFSDALYDQVLADLIAAGYTEVTAEYMMSAGGLRIDSTLDPKIQAIANEEFENAENYNQNVHWYLNYALTITDLEGTKHNYSKEKMMTWFKENKDLNFNLIFTSQEAAYEAIDTYRSAMLESLGMDKESTNYEESISMTPQPQAAIVIEDQSSGYVVAMVGGRGTKEGRRTLNRATSAGSSPGSTFKVLASFAPALDAGGQTLATVYNDAPFNYSNGQPVSNWYDANTKGYKGICSIRYAIEQSLNIIAVKTFTVVTPEVGYQYLLNFGFTTLTDGVWIGDQHYSDVQQPTAIGGITYGVSPYELNAAYASIANLGYYMTPKLYTRVTDADGNIILDNTTPQSHQVLKETTAFLLTDAMRDVVTKGTGARVNFNSNMAIAGKTGTSQKTQDVWFAGYTPYYTATVWAGYDNNVNMNTSSSESVNESNTAKRLWKAIMKRVHEDLPNINEFPIPEGLVEMEICSKSGLLPTPGLCDALGCVKTEYFAEGTEPTEQCNVHYRGRVCAYSGLIASEECPFAYEGTAMLSLPENPALLQGSTTIIENEDGTTTVISPHTSNYCPHDAMFFLDPNYEAILNQHQWEINQRGGIPADETSGNNDESDDD